MALFLTYDAEAQQDGVGAQLIRIFGIYSISQAFGVGYIHTPISNIIEEVSHNFKSEMASQNFKTNVNDYFQIDSFSPIKIDSVKIYKQISIWQLLKLIIAYKHSKSCVVVKVLYPFKITDRIPNIYSYAKNYFWEKHADKLRITPGIVAHVRFGYGFLYTDEKNMRAKHLPLSYFRDIIKYLQHHYSHTTKPNITIHTDLRRYSKIWTPAQHEIAKILKGSKGGQDSVYIPGVDLHRKLELPSDNITIVKYSEDFFDTFYEMCTAEIFVMGRSALSYLAAIINPNLVIYPENHGHTSLPDWVSSRQFLKADYPLIYEADLESFLLS
jgi:hypothetical protein